jgi:hypothetical protein
LLARIRYAQLCDASATVPAPTAALSEEARYDRLLPGEGGLPLREFIKALPSGIPFGLKAPNRRLAETLELDERLSRTLSAAKRVAGGLTLGRFAIAGPVGDRPDEATSCATSCCSNAISTGRTLMSCGNADTPTGLLAFRLSPIRGPHRPQLN